ncbi:hypothetical protein [uncultured Paludibaculum sp.]|uniref:hypothetical protein n=1 Tax=uncultured Paludibaculum sp. TaxID=1765020 RepID=UPI002AABEF2D|nr:hypothetical protein [uncultured Paludibaculum sp.]
MPRTNTQPMKFALTATGRQDYKNLNRDYAVHTYDHSAYQYRPHAELKHISLRGGELFVDGLHIQNPSHGPNFVRFANSADGLFISGLLQFSPDGRSFTGQIFRGTSAATATEHHVCGTTPPTVYRSQVSTTGETAPTGKSFPEWQPSSLSNPNTTWAEGPAVTLGFKENKLKDQFDAIYELTDKNGHSQDVTDSIVGLVDPKNNNLMLTMDLIQQGGIEEYLEQFGADAPVAFCLEFAFDGATYSGVMQKAVSDGHGGYKLDPGQLGWKGTAQPAVHAAAFQRGASVGALSDDDTLSKTELINLVPDAQKLQENQLTLLQENMRWALGEDANTKKWLDDFYGSIQPNFNEARKTLVKKNLAFYTVNFFASTNGHSFNTMTGSGAPTTKLTDAENNNLDFYLRAGIGSHEGYTVQSRGVALDAYRMTVSRLALYVADQDKHTRNGVVDPEHNWAQILYDYMTTPFIMNQAVNKIILGHGMDEANNRATILMALQPSGDLARDYHNRLTCRSLHLPIEHLNLNDKDKVGAWLTDTIQAYIDGLLHDKLKADIDPVTKARMIQTAREVQQAVDAAGNVANLAAKLATIVVAADGKAFWEKLASAQTTMQKVGYGFAKGFYVIAILGGIMQSISAFANWNKLTDDRKATAVISTIAIVAKIVEKVPEIAEGGAVAWTTLKELNKVQADKEVLEDTLSCVNIADENAITNGASEVTELVTDATKLEGSAWGLFEKTIGMACKVIGVLAAIGFAALSTYTFIKDLLTGAPIKTAVLDGIMMAANICAAAFAFAGVVVTAMGITTAIPVIGGAIAAIIGIVAALIAMFWPTPPPVSPVERFMTEVMKPAVAPTGWVKPAPQDWRPGDPIPPKNAYNPVVAALTQSA